MIKIPIGKDKYGKKVYVETVGIDRRENAITNKKIAINQHAKITEYSNDLRKQMKKHSKVRVY